MLLQVLYSVRSERQLMEQVQYNLLFRWFIELSVDDTVWVPTVFTKNRERLIKHDAVIEFFNEILDIAQNKHWLSGEYFSAGGTLIQAWAGHKSCVRRDDDQDPRDGGNFKGETCINETHESKSDPYSRLYRKGNTASELRYMGHPLSDNRHGLIASAVVTLADGYAEREAAKVIINDARQSLGDAMCEITLGADKGYDAAEFIEACQEMNITPHVAQNKPGTSRLCPSQSPRMRLCGVTAKAQAHQTGFWLGQEHRRYSPGDGARPEEGRSGVCADDGRLQPRAYAQLGATPSAAGAVS